MLILHTNFLRGWGGQSNRVLCEAIGIRDRGHRVVLSVPPGSKLGVKGRAAGLEVVESVNYVGGARLGVIRDIREMVRLLRELRPDLVHLHGGRDSWVVAGAMRFLPRELRPRIIRTKHNVFPVPRHFLNTWFYARFCEMLIGLSQAIVQQLTELPKVDASRVRRIPSAVEADRMAAPEGTRERLRPEFGLSPEHTVVTMVGRLQPEKGHSVFLDAAEQILPRKPNVRFLVVGSGSLLGEAERRVNESELLRGRVILTGFRDDVRDCLAASDIYAQPSLSEGLGTSVIEACAAGLPVVASRTGGIPDVVVDGECGLLFPVGDSAAMAQALLELIDSTDRRKVMGHAAKLRAETEFSIPRLIERTHAAYNELLQLPRR